MEIKFKPVHTAKDLIISAIVVAAGIGLCFVNTALGAVIGACGLLMLLLYKAGHKRVGENILLSRKAMDLAHKCRSSLIDFLDGRNIEPEVIPSDGTGVIRLEVYYNEKEAVAYAQLFDFSSYTYEAATEITEIRGPRATKLISKL